MTKAELDALQTVIHAARCHAQRMADNPDKTEGEAEDEAAIWEAVDLLMREVVS